MSIQTGNWPEYSEIRIVTAEDSINNFSVVGWVLLAVFQEDHLVDLTKRTVTKMIMGRKNDDVLHELKATVTSCHREIKDLRQEVQTLDGELSLKDKEIDRLKQEKSLIQEHYSENAKRVNDTQHSLHKIERDFGKVKQAIGELRLKEILGK